MEAIRALLLAGIAIGSALVMGGAIYYRGDDDAGSSDAPLMALIGGVLAVMCGLLLVRWYLP
jgi:hypothetical protein